jgi:hypothetical protein
MSLRIVPTLVLAAALCAIGSAAWAESPDAAEDGDAPVGLERLKKDSNPSGPLPGGSEDAADSGPTRSRPDGAKGLGHGPEGGAGNYTPGAPPGSEKSRADSIGGGTRVNSGAGSALDDIK